MEVLSLHHSERLHQVLCGLRRGRRGPLFGQGQRHPAPGLRGRTPLSSRVPHALLLQPVPHPDPVQVRQEQEPVVLQMPQNQVPILSVGGCRTVWQSETVAGARRETGCQTQRTETQTLRFGRADTDASFLRGKEG